MAFDLNDLDAGFGRPVELLGFSKIKHTLTSDAVEGFDEVARVEIIARIGDIRGERSPSVTVEVLDGDDENVAGPWTFTNGGEQRQTVDNPPDSLHVVCTPGGGIRDVVIREVVAVIGALDPRGGPSGGDGLPDTAGHDEGDVLQLDGSLDPEWGPAPAGGSQPNLAVTLTDVDVDGPVTAIAFTIPANYLSDGDQLQLNVQPVWTTGPYNTLELVIGGNTPILVANRVYPDDDAVTAPFAITLARSGTSLLIASAPPNIDGTWELVEGEPDEGEWGSGLTQAGLDFTAAITFALQVTLDSASASNYWHPLGAFAAYVTPAQVLALMLQALGIFQTGDQGGFLVSPWGPSQPSFVEFVQIAPDSLSVSSSNASWVITGPDEATAFYNYVLGIGSHDEGTMWWVTTKGGYEVLKHSATPPDPADIQPGECFNYYDGSNGAAKFVRIGKTLDGTVVTAETAMT